MQSPPVLRYLVPPRSQIFSSTPCSQTHSASFPPAISATKFHTFYFPFSNVFQNAVPTQDVTNPFRRLSFFFFFTVCRKFVSFPSFYFVNTSSFLTRSVQLIFSILLQHRISKCLNHFQFIFCTGALGFHRRHPLLESPPLMKVLHPVF